MDILGTIIFAAVAAYVFKAKWLPLVKKYLNK